VRWPVHALPVTGRRLRGAAPAGPARYFLAMTSQTEKAARFLALHRPGSPLLLPNPWDQGSAKLLASLGFQALATTSSGFAATLGRSDGSVSGDEALAHAAAIVAATDLPVSADLENCFADDPDGVARTVALAVETGLAGCSVEDFTGDDDEPFYDIGPAAERVAAAVEAAHAGSARLVLTARAENYLYGRPDLADTIARLQAYQAAGADVLYAPGLTSLTDIRQLVSAVDRPVNVLAIPGTPPVSELAAVGVSRVSVGGALAFAALGALVDAATELRDKGTYRYLAGSAAGRKAFKGIVLAAGNAADRGQFEGLVSSRAWSVLWLGQCDGLVSARARSVRGQRSGDVDGDAPLAVWVAVPDGRVPHRDARVCCARPGGDLDRDGAQGVSQVTRG